MALSKKNRVIQKPVYVMNACKSCEPSGFLLSKVLKFLKINGHVLVDDPSKTKTVLINTCCVTQQKIREATDQIQKATEIPGIERIIVFGCAGKLPDVFPDHEKIICIGPKEIHRFNDLVIHVKPIESIDVSEIEPHQFISYQKKIDHSDYFIIISQGCEHNCTYCNIRRAKGKTESRSIPEIQKNIKEGRKKEFSEFVLLADDCGSYGADIGCDLADLISVIFRLEPDIKLKIYSINPGDLVRLYAKLKPHIESERITYINIPIQSGSDRILKLMKRDYDIQEVLSVVGEIRKASPETWLYTHILFRFTLFSTILTSK